MAPYVSKIWVYPVKACRGTEVQSADLVKSGFALDRQWCVVDSEGKRYPRNEFLSQRKLRHLATVAVEVREGEGVLRITSDNPAVPMEPLIVPLVEEAYGNQQSVSVVCGGASTTDPENATWCLGTVESKSAGPEAEQWFTDFLLAADVEKKSKPRTRFQLVRMPAAGTRSCADYCGPDQKTGAVKGIPGAKMDAFGARAGDGAAFHDFAPFLLISEASCRDTAERMGLAMYPPESMRASIMVSGCAAWEEEEWLSFDVGGCRFRKIKECPRCSVPCRNQATGDYVFAGSPPKRDGVAGSKLQLQVTLGKVFPKKAKDPEWGSWAGPVMGVYVGHDDAPGSISVGSPVTVVEKVRAPVRCCSPMVIVPVVLAPLLAFALMKYRSP
ncbi:Molybdenum cofactor sulfurase [Diplonema papillatum]|nr:Molybdenum cofactor sulfurase [Diplonema papillatum]